MLYSPGSKEMTRALKRTTEMEIVSPYFAFVKSKASLRNSFSVLAAFVFIEV